MNTTGTYYEGMDGYNGCDTYQPTEEDYKDLEMNRENECTPPVYPTYEEDQNGNLWAVYPNGLGCRV